MTLPTGRIVYRPFAYCDPMREREEGGTAAPNSPEAMAIARALRERLAQRTGHSAGKRATAPDREEQSK